MDDVLNIALSANERYMQGALVAAASLAVYAKPGTSLHFHLFTEGVKNETFEFFEATLKRLHVASEVTRHECDERILSGLPYWAGSRMAAVRCHYATLMPDVDWCLYLDCDVLYLASVEEHFSFRDEFVYACVVQEESSGCRLAECKWIKENCGVDVADNEYFNSGVVLFNLKKMRDDGIPARLVKFFSEHPKPSSPDQNALNMALVGHTKLIPQKFDRLQIYLTDEKLLERPVVHYVCGNPWLPKYGEVASGRFRLWHMFADAFVYRSQGGSYRRQFSRKVLMVKYISYWLLKLPLVWRLYVWVLCWLRLIVHPERWRWNQVGYDVSEMAVRRVLAER